jgi:chromosome segregation ATPase
MTLWKLEDIQRLEDAYGRQLEQIERLQAALDQADQRLQEMTKERDEARAIVADVNNSVIGSHGYFTTPSCVEAIENYKVIANQMVHAHEDLTSRLQEMEEKNKALAEDLRTVCYAANRANGTITALEAERTQLREALQEMTGLASGYSTAICREIHMVGTAALGLSQESNPPQKPVFPQNRVIREGRDQESKP